MLVEKLRQRLLHLLDAHKSDRRVRITAAPVLARWWRAAAEKRRRRLAAPVRLGILGAARIAVKNCKAIEAVPGSVVVVAVASRDPAKAEAFVAANGLPEGTKCCSYDELIADPDIDALAASNAAASSGTHNRWNS
mgnify:CR=1 FL=1